MRAYAELFLTFCSIGGLTFGGGYAMLPMLQREVVEKKGWATEAEVMDYFAVGQCLPGIIAVNTALFIGNKNKGVWGAIAAALGVVFPSLVIILAIAAFINNFSHLPLVQNAFAGIRACVFVLVVNAVAKLRKGALVDWITVALTAAVCALSVFTDLSPVWLVLGAGALGLALRGAKGGKA